MADWITITGYNSDNAVVLPVDGKYDSETVRIDFDYDQNTTVSTRAASLLFENAIAEEKNAYNPESPDGMAEFFLYQFGKRSMNISANSPQSCPPTAAGQSCTGNYQIFSNKNIADGQLQPYTSNGSYSIDFTLTDPSNPNVGGATEYQQNAEQKFRNYFVSNDQAVPYTINLTIESSAPWLIEGGDFWTGVPTEYFRGLGSVDWAAERTYTEDDTLQTVVVPISISQNNTGNTRTTTLTVRNRQGVRNNITFTQAEFVLPNQPPIPRITGGIGSTCNSSVSASWSGATSSDPDGVITDYDWTSPGNPSTGTGTSFFTTINVGSNSSCTSNSNATGPSLTVTDDRLASNSTTAGITLLSRLSCEGGCDLSITGCGGVVGFDASVTCNVSVSTRVVSGCNNPPAGTPSITAGNASGSTSVTFSRSNFGITIPGQSGTVSASASHAYNSCGDAVGIQFGQAIQPPTINFTGDGNVSSASGTVGASCSPNDPNNASPFSYQWSGAGSGSNSTTSATYSGLNQGQSQNFSFTCRTTNSFNQSAQASRTATVTRPAVSYNCSGGNCSDPGNGSGTFSTLAACQAMCVSCSGGGTHSANSLTNPSPAQVQVTLSGAAGTGQICYTGEFLNQGLDSLVVDGRIIGPLPAGTNQLNFLGNNAFFSGGPKSGCVGPVTLQPGTYILSGGATTIGSSPGTLEIILAC